MTKTLHDLFFQEEIFLKKLQTTPVAKDLFDVQKQLLNHVKEVQRSNDLPQIIATEKAILKNELARYSNSRQMENSLKTALNEISVIEKHLAIVDDKSQYQVVNQAHSLPRNRKKGLPHDEAHQSLKSHYARLNNMDRSRLSATEKKIIDTRKSCLFTAGKLYSERQAKTLGIQLTQKRGKSL